MKKVIIVLVCLVAMLHAKSQNNLYYDITQGPFPSMAVCYGDYDSLIMFNTAPEIYLWQTHWIIDIDFCGNPVGQNSFHEEIWHEDTIKICLTLENIKKVTVDYEGNNVNGGFGGIFQINIMHFDENFDPWFVDYVWKRYNDSVWLHSLDVISPPNMCIVNHWEIMNIPYDGFNHWFSNPGTYWCRLYNDCGEVFDTIEVRDNVEIYQASSDLLSNHNMITWKTTPEQAEYIASVHEFRNQEEIATVPYADSVFIDNIGSEGTNWQYHLIAETHHGELCPITSYWKRTIHLDHIQGSDGSRILQWTPYAEEDGAGSQVVAYSIFDVVDGVPTHIIDVGNFTNVYAYNPADFHGYGVVAAKFKANDKAIEQLAFSNHTLEIIGIDDFNDSKQKTNIFPNPNNGNFTVRKPSVNGHSGSATTSTNETVNPHDVGNQTVNNQTATTYLTIFNVNGVIVFRQPIVDETEIRNLQPGVYFVQIDGFRAEKVVVD